MVLACVTVQTTTDMILGPLGNYSLQLLSVRDARNPKRQARILCAEDDADSRALIVFVLTREGYDVTSQRQKTP
ncbi:MAG TPA: response regulator [Pyrinomonadaceae bacterium]|nr:response regulator [Pyrinomonadaceae bacterium]